MPNRHNSHYTTLVSSNDVAPRTRRLSRGRGDEACPIPTASRGGVRSGRCPLADRLRASSRSSRQGSPRGLSVKRHGARSAAAVRGCLAGIDFVGVLPGRHRSWGSVALGAAGAGVRGVFDVAPTTGRCGRGPRRPWILPTRTLVWESMPSRHHEPAGPAPTRGPAITAAHSTSNSPVISGCTSHRKT